MLRSLLFTLAAHCAVLLMMAVPQIVWGGP